MIPGGSMLCFCICLHVGKFVACCTPSHLQQHSFAVCLCVPRCSSCPLRPLTCKSPIFVHYISFKLTALVLDNTHLVLVGGCWLCYCDTLSVVSPIFYVVSLLVLCSRTRLHLSSKRLECHVLKQPAPGPLLSYPTFCSGV